MTEQAVRKERDILLTESDRYSLPDAPITHDEFCQWRRYRQALRDIPQQLGFPDAIIWPQKPERAAVYELADISEIP